MAFRWRKQPKLTGTRALGGSRPLGFDLRESAEGKVIAWVRPRCHGYDYLISGWCWSVKGYNTSSDLVNSADEAKVLALAFCRANPTST
jgi:hypothetical protein